MIQSKIEIELERHELFPGDILIGEFRIRKLDEPLISAIEISVLWTTDGKGEEDIGVHFFERKQSLPAAAYLDSHKMTTVLPSTPLSYSGRILNVLWLVRVKVFFEDGSSKTEDCPFLLGNGCFFESLTTDDNEGENDASA